MNAGGAPATIGGDPTRSPERTSAMTAKAVVSLCTGLEDPEKVTVAFLVAVGAAERAARP